MRTSLQQGICRAAGLIVEDSFCRVHRVEAAADPDGTFAMARVEPCFPGACEDGYSRGGPSASRAVLMLAASRSGRREQAWLERPGLPASGSCCRAVSVRLALAGAAGDGVRRVCCWRGRRAGARWFSDLWPLD